MSLLQLSIDPKRHLPYIVIISIVLLTLAGYYTWRIKARETDFLAYREEISRLRKEMQENAPVAMRGDPAAVARQALQDLQQQRDTLQQALQQHTANRVDLAAENATNEVMLELSSLAQQTGRIRFSNSAPTTERPGGMPIRDGFADPLGERPRQRLQLEARYVDLQRFLQALGNARHTVTVLNMAIKTLSLASNGDSPVLQVDLMVML